MVDNQLNVPASTPPRGLRGSNSGFRDRGAGRGTSHSHHNHLGHSENLREIGRSNNQFRGQRRGRGGGRGGSRGGYGQQNLNQTGRSGHAQFHARPESSKQPRSETHFDGEITSRTSSNGGAESPGGEGSVTVKLATTDEPDDGEVCFICASKVEHTAVAPCNHRTCHICALRLRALYKTKACAHCRSESPYVVFTDNTVKRFEEFTSSDLVRTDDNLGIKYENDEIFEDTVILLRYNCPDKDCDTACLGWPDLHRHVKSKHGRVMCDLCTRNKKVFTHEHELFTNAELRKHEKYGDDNPGAIDQSGFRGHPDCGFCRERFYGDDELYAHCRDKHERCHICDRRVSNRQHQYYINYDALEDHFQKEHFLCLDKECLEKKFIVFETQMDLKAHQLEAHPHGLSKDARRDARLVDMSNFDYRTPYQPQRQRRDGQGAGRGRDPNADPIPISSAQPMRRDELAYQRQMAIQSAQSVSTRSFGGQLTSTNTQPAREPRPISRAAADPTSAQANAASHTPPTARMENLSLISDINFASLPPQEQARRLRHNMVIERAAGLLRNDQSKLAEFRTKVSNYRTSVINATELIDSFFFLFDASSSDLGKLIKELAEIYEDESKKNALLKAWNDWRAINEDYPALPGPSGALPGMNSSTGLGSAAGGKRVLRLKSSTAQSSRAAAVGRGVSIAGVINANSIFPPLPATTRMSANAPAWGGVSSTPSSGISPSLGSRPSGTSPRTGTPALSSDEAFPALPAAPKPNTLMAGLTRGTVRWNDHRPTSSGNIWGASSPGLGSRSGAGNDEEFPNLGAHGPPAGGNTVKGKGKKQKQTLFHFG